MPRRRNLKFGVVLPPDNDPRWIPTQQQISPQLAYNAMQKGGNMPCILNAANEIAVAAFLQDKVGFLNMSDLIADCMEKITFVSSPTLEDYIATDDATRKLANEIL